MQERRLPFILVSFFLMISLGTWILSASLARTVGQADQTKELLHESGIYQAIIPAQLAEAQKNNPSLSNIPLNNPQVQKLLGSSLDAQKLQSEGDKAVDGIYSWLEGKSERPKLAIDVVTDAQELSTTLSDLAARHAADLRPCVTGQDDYSSFSTDPISATCLPPGVSPDVVRSYVSQSVQGNPTLTATTQLNEEDIKFTNGKTIMETFDSAPVWYQRAQLLPRYSLIAAGVLLLLLLVILKPVAGIRSAGKHMLAVGITLSLCAVLIAWAVEKLYSWIVPKSDNPNLGDAIMALTNGFNAALRDNIITVSASVAGVGLILFVGAWIAQRLRKPAAKKFNRNSESSDSAVSLAKPPASVSFTPAVSKSADKVKGAPPLPKTRKAAAKRKPTAKKSTVKKKTGK
jgi:hypothetical protein